MEKIPNKKAERAAYSRKTKAALEAANAYRETAEQTDPLGSYTGTSHDTAAKRGRSDAQRRQRSMQPTQDADDL